MNRMKNLTDRTMLLALMLSLACALPALAQSDDSSGKPDKPAPPSRVYTNKDLPTPPPPPEPPATPSGETAKTAGDAQEDDTATTPPKPAAAPKPPAAPIQLATPTGRVFTNDDLPSPPPTPEDAAPAAPPLPAAAGSRVFTNDDLPPSTPADDADQGDSESDSTGTGDTPAESEGESDETASGEETARILTGCDRMYAGTDDRDGHDCAWWQARVRDHYDAEDVAFRELKLAEESFLELERVSRDTRYRNTVVFASDRARIRAAQAEVDRLQTLKEELFEEARRAGALPGWLREASRP